MTRPDLQAVRALIRAYSSNSRVLVLKLKFFTSQPGNITWRWQSYPKKITEGWGSAQPLWRSTMVMSGEVMKRSKQVSFLTKVTWTWLIHLSRQTCSWKDTKKRRWVSSTKSVVQSCSSHQDRAQMMQVLSEIGTIWVQLKNLVATRNMEMEM